ncbi:MAG: RloB family protein [Paludisphaera borealis]|uniref:RloB family protein n=1 Tax=Paludisphaera borealis TaxID=1387353 RepID=UPI00283C422F|nr:RloB family protein [Paludisphaera borealis]MDR3621320.1 RloB family protein [Paludisphaera borealis]
MSNHRDRERRPGRRKAFRDPIPVVLVVCEGERTEPDYLKGYERACRNTRVSIKTESKRTTPEGLVKKAVELRDKAVADEAAYDSVWCVFDVDDHPSLPRAKDQAHAGRIELAISNPCFELWLLLHFQEHPGMQDRRRVKAMLRKHVPHYDKAVDYTTYATSHPHADKRAERLDQAAEKANEPGRNPSTGVYQLIRIIEKKS